MRTSGVLPTRSMTESAILMPGLLFCAIWGNHTSHGYPPMFSCSANLDHDLEVLARHHQRAVGGPVHPLREPEQVLGERRLLVGTERCESLVHGPVVGAKGVEPVQGRAVAEDEMPARRLERGDPVAEKRAQMCFRPPQRGRF